MAAFVALLGSARVAHAQQQHVVAYASAGTGLSIAAAGGQSFLRRTPIFLDIGARTWSTDQGDLVYGGSLRMELEGRVGVGVVPKIAFQRSFGPLTVMAGGGLPFFFAPYSLLGLEGNAEVHLTIAGVFGVYLSALFDVFFIGNDKPVDGALLMLNGVLGVELLF